MGNQVGREGAEHDQVEYADLQAPILPQVVRNDLRIANHRTLPDDHVIRIFQPVAHGTGIAAASESRVLLKRLVGQCCNMIKIEGALRRDTLCVGFLVLHHAQACRIIKIIELGNAPAPLTKHGPLCGCRCIDQVLRGTQVLLDQLALRLLVRLDYMAGEEAVLGAYPGVERKLRNAMRNEIQVGNALHVFGEYLEKTSVINSMVVIVPGVDIERVLGHCAAGHVQDIGQPFAHRCVERFVHIGYALAAGEVGRAQAHHAHAGGHTCSGMLSFGFKVNQAAPIDIFFAVGDRRCPAFSHLGGRRDRIGACCLTGRSLHRNDSGASIPGSENPRVPGLIFVLFTSPLHTVLLSSSTGLSSNCCPSTHTIAPVSQRAIALGSVSEFFS